MERICNQDKLRDGDMAAMNMEENHSMDVTAAIHKRGGYNLVVRKSYASRGFEATTSNVEKGGIGLSVLIKDSLIPVYKKKFII